MKKVSKKKINTTLKNIENKLNNIDSEKTTYLKQSLDRSGYGPQPDDLKRGDIVWVEFGINVGTELSDHQTKGHYAIVWAVDLGNVIVIPLSSRPAPGSCLTYDVGVIEGLVEEGVNYKSYLKLDAIRSVSKRRIGRMPGKCGGKVTIDQKLLNTVQDIIRKNLVD